MGLILPSVPIPLIHGNISSVAYQSITCDLEKPTCLGFLSSSGRANGTANYDRENFPVRFSSDPPAPDGEKLERFRERQRFNDGLIGVYREAVDQELIEPSVLDALEQCHRTGKVYLPEREGEPCEECRRERRVAVRPTSCRGLLCAHCNHARSARIVAGHLRRKDGVNRKHPGLDSIVEEAVTRSRVVKGLVSVEYSVHFLTFTVPSVESLDRGLVFKELNRAFNRMRKRSFWKKGEAGGCRIIETTKGEAGWHPHIHVLVEWKGPYLDYVEARRQFKSCLPEWFQELVEAGQPEGKKDRVVGWGTRVEDPQGAARELAKYVAKGSALREPAAVVEYLQAGKNRRFFEYFGSWRERYRAAEEQESESKWECPHGYEYVFAGNKWEPFSAAEIVDGQACLDREWFDLFFTSRRKILESSLPWFSSHGPPAVPSPASLPMEFFMGLRTDGF